MMNQGSMRYMHSDEEITKNQVKASVRVYIEEHGPSTAGEMAEYLSMAGYWIHIPHVTSMPFHPIQVEGMCVEMKEVYVDDSNRYHLGVD